jgi:hypothetical protein
MTRIKVGDRVEYTGVSDRVKYGYKGTVVDIYNNGADTVIYIDWDKHLHGHTCEGLARQGHGWNVYSRHVKLIASDVLNPSDVKYADIIRKTRELTKRFENRKKGTDYAF